MPQQLQSKKSMPYFHPIPVHFPLALYPSSFLSFLLYFFYGLLELEHAAYIMLFLGTVALPLTIISGIADWKIRYRGQLTRVFKIKIISAFLILIFSLPAILIRFANPELVALPLNLMGWVYFILLGFSLIPCMIVGHYGGTLVFH